MRTVQAIPVTLDKPRTLLLDLKALAKAEQALATFWGEKRVSLIKVFQNQEMGVAELTHLLWAGLLHEEPALTYDGAMALVTKIDLQQIATLVAAAMKEQLGMEDAPQGQAGDPPQPVPSPTGTGANSGPPPATTSA